MWCSRATSTVSASCSSSFASTRSSATTSRSCTAGFERAFTARPTDPRSRGDGLKGSYGLSVVRGFPCLPTSARHHACATHRGFARRNARRVQAANRPAASNSYPRQRARPPDRRRASLHPRFRSSANSGGSPDVARASPRLYASTQRHSRCTFRSIPRKTSRSCISGSKKHVSVANEQHLHTRRSRSPKRARLTQVCRSPVFDRNVSEENRALKPWRGTCNAPIATCAASAPVSTGGLENDSQWLWIGLNHRRRT